MFAAIAIGGSGFGDLYLPEGAGTNTQMVLCIHGGGWRYGERSWMRGVADFFLDRLGFAVFNVEYRLAGPENRWPACGDDCVKAAKYVLSDDFRRRHGLGFGKIWICGGSAGGHLALWTLVNLPPESVAGVISISSIGDPAPDFKAHPGRYAALFGDAAEARLAEMNPVRRISGGMTPLLCTHATADAVVPIASHRAFASAYAAAGNRCEFFEYASDREPNTGGHCIWRPGSNPHRLLECLETRIIDFVKGNEGK